MARLIERIREMYAATIKNLTVDDVELIRWCVDNDYMQQALTLYTERVPEYLGAHGLITQSPEEADKLDERVKNDDMGRNRWFYLLNEYPALKEYSFGGGNKQMSNGERFYCNALKRNALLDIRKKRFEYEAWRRGLDERLAAFEIKCEDEPRLRTQLELLSALKDDPTPLSTPDDPALDPIRNIIDELRAEFEEMPQPTQRFNRVCQFIGNLQNHLLKNYFPAIVNAVQYPHAAAVKEMLEAHIFDITIDKNKFLDIMEHYFRLKKERNQSNHARADRGEFDNTADLKKFIEEGIDGLKSVAKIDE